MDPRLTFFCAQGALRSRAREGVDAYRDAPPPHGGGYKENAALCVAARVSAWTALATDPPPYGGGYD